MDLTQGARLGPYEILGPLAAGGMGQVFRARDVKLDRPVAIKVLRDDLAQDPEWLAHYVVLHELTDTGVIVDDPETGIVNWSAEFLAGCYSGALLLFDLRN